jgi:hypothetical protein
MQIRIASRRRARWITCATTIASFIIPISAHAQSTALAAEFKPLLDARYAAIARADTSVAGRGFADDLSWFGIAGAGLSKAQLLALTSKPQVPAPTYRVDGIRARRVGDVAIVEYRRTDHRSVGQMDQNTTVDAQEVFVRRNGKWLLELHTQSWVVKPAKPIAFDAAKLRAFVGRYQIAPGYVDNVHLEANQLVATATGQTVGAKLVPVSADAFSPDGVGALIVFERDSTGRVTGYVQGYPNGDVFRARRLP